MKRRALLSCGVRGGLTLGISKALHNTVAGYGHIGIGENLLTQDLDALAAEEFRVPIYYETTIDGVRVRVTRTNVRYESDHNGWRTVDVDAPASVGDFASDISSLRSGSFSFSFMGPDAFFESLAGSATRPHTVEAIRGSRYPSADPEAVEAFVGHSARQSEDVVVGLVEAFREHSHYDVMRYLAGAVDDNLLPIEAGLRNRFVPDASFEAFVERQESVGLFCGEYTILARRAVQSVPASVQSPPLRGMLVHDRRHKHVYNAFASVQMTSSGLDIPVTFVDYMDTTLYDDLGLTGVLGSGFDAYDSWHRADVIMW